MMSARSRILLASGTRASASLLVAALLLVGAAAPAGAAPLVAVDAGHGGPDPGAQNCSIGFAGKPCLSESDVNLDIALRAEAILRGIGLRTVLTRTGDTRVNEPAQDLATWNPEPDGSHRFYADGRIDGRDELQARVNVGNCGAAHPSCPPGSPSQADAFVSVHNNSCGGCGAQGTETYRFSGSADGSALAGRIQNEVVSRAGRPDRGVKEAGFYVLRWTRMPSALLEGSFVDNDQEARLLVDPAYRQLLAEGVATGVARYLAFRAILALEARMRAGFDPGARRTDEVAVPGGWGVTYDRARLYWSPPTDAHEVHGAILDRYLAFGGPGSVAGLPVTDEISVPRGRASYFQGAHIYWSPDTWSHIVYGAILGKYLEFGGPASVAGLPTTDEIAVAGGRASHFEGARVYWTHQTWSHIVYGAILAKYLEFGGPASLAGFPVTDEIGEAGGRVSHFQGARIYWTPQTWSHIVYGAILGKYLWLGGPASFAGFPVTDELDVLGGRVSHFQGASIYWSGFTGAYEVHGAILGKYLELGGPTGQLGFPVSDEYDVPGGRRSDFQRGSISWDRQTGALQVRTL